MNASRNIIFALLAGLLLMTVTAGSSQAAQPSVSLTAAISTDNQTVTLTLSGSVDPGGTCTLTLTSDQEPAQSQDCSAWTTGSSVYTFAITPGYDYTAAVSIYNPDGHSQTTQRSFTVPQNQSPTAPDPSPPSDPISTPSTANPTLDVEQVEATSAVLDLDGSTEPGSSCLIELSIGSIEKRRIDCSAWTGGPEQIPLANLRPDTGYSVSLSLTAPEGANPWAKVEFTTLDTDRPSTPGQGSGCKAKSCQGTSSGLRIKLAVACSRNRLSRRDNRCSINSGSVAQVSATRYGKFKLCLRYPVFKDALGGAEFQTACTRWQIITGHRSVVLPLRKVLPVAFRWPHLGIAWTDETISVVTPGHGLSTPSATQSVRFSL